MAMKLATLLTQERPLSLFAKKVIPILGKGFKLFGVEKNEANSRFIVCFTEYFWVEVFPQCLVSFNPDYILPEYQYTVHTYKNMVNKFGMQYSIVRDLDYVLDKITKELKPKRKRFWHYLRFFIFVKNSLKWQLAREDKCVPTKQTP